MMIKSNQDTLIFIVLMMIAFVIRLITIDSNCFAHDELATMEYARRGYLNLWSEFQTNDEPFTPYYYMFIKLMTESFTNPRLAARLPSLVAGMISLVYLFKLSRVWLSQWQASIILFLAVLSPTHIFYSQEARPYIFLYLFTLLVMYKTQSISNEKSKLSITNTTKLTIFLFLLVHSHYFGLFFALFNFILIVIFNKYLVKSYIIALTITLLSYAPWFTKTLGHFFYSPFNTWLPNIGIFESMSSIYGFYFSGRYQFFPSFLTFLFLSLSLIAIIRYIRKKDKVGMLLTLWLYIPTLLLLIKSEITHPSFHKRYLIISMPAAQIAFIHFFNTFKIKRLKEFSIFIFILITLITSYSYPNAILAEKDCKAPPTNPSPSVL